MLVWRIDKVASHSCYRYGLYLLLTGVPSFEGVMFWISYSNVPSSSVYCVAALSEKINVWEVSCTNLDNREYVSVSLLGQ